jgi:anti-sigma regulatory factor (Ser/Thr protein kinase)
LRNTTVTFDIHQCRFIRQNGIAFLGGLICLLQHNDCSVVIKPPHLKSIYRHLSGCGFFEQLFDQRDAPRSSTAIHYREDPDRNEHDYIEYLKEKWLRPDRAVLPNQVQEYIIQYVIEAYVNVYEHAHSPIGSVTYGQFYPNLRQIKLVIVDFGIGSPSSVRSRLGVGTMASDEALRLAVTGDPRIRAGRLARGLGLQNLRTFVSETHGKLEIYAENAYACVAQNQQRFEQQKAGFSGTLIQITLPSNESAYVLPKAHDFDSSDGWF